MELLNKRVQVISGPFKGHRFTATTFEQGLYWSEIDDEVLGFEPQEVREISRARRLVRRVLSFFSRSRT